jgi:hypothetical protein
MAGGREKTGLRALSTPNTIKVVKGLPLSNPRG